MASKYADVKALGRLGERRVRKPHPFEVARAQP